MRVISGLAVSPMNTIMFGAGSIAKDRAEVVVGKDNGDCEGDAR